MRGIFSRTFQYGARCHCWPRSQFCEAAVSRSSHEPRWRSACTRPYSTRGSCYRRNPSFRCQRSTMLPDGAREAVLGVLLSQRRDRISIRALPSNRPFSPPCRCPRWPLRGYPNRLMIVVLLGDGNASRIPHYRHALGAAPAAPARSHAESAPVGLPPAAGSRPAGTGWHFLRAAHRLPMEGAERNGHLLQQHGPRPLPAVGSGGRVCPPLGRGAARLRGPDWAGF